MNHRFEDIQVKVNAIELLEETLKVKRKKSMIITGSMTDPYIPIEMELEKTRKSLEVIYKYGFGVSIITKSKRILRDLDILKKINKKTKCVVQMSLTTYSEELCKKIEPNVSTTKERFDTLKILNENNIPTVVWIAPILPYINDNEENIRGIMDYCVRAKVKGIICFGMGLTLRSGNREYFYKELDKNFEGVKNKYIKDYGGSYEVVSKDNDYLMDIIKDICNKNNIIFGVEENFKYIEGFEENNPEQIMFDIFDN